MWRYFWLIQLRVKARGTCYAAEHPVVQRSAQP